MPRNQFVQYCYSLCSIAAHLIGGYFMRKMAGTFVKGIATGMAVGTAVGMMVKPFKANKRTNMRKNASKALRAVGEIVQNAQYMMK